MEEKEKKVQEMKVEGGQDVKKKLSYDELNKIVSELYQRNIQMGKQLQEMNVLLVNKKLDYMLKVIENPSLFSGEFVKKCVAEIEESLTYEPEPAAEKEVKGE